MRRSRNTRERDGPNIIKENQSHGKSTQINATHVGQVINYAGDRESKDDRCLTDLYVTDPRDDKERIEQTKGGLLEGSYRWILDNADFLRWRQDEQTQLLWIKGDPGKGKTMLLCGIIDELKKSPAETGLLSFFFCQAIDSRINNAAAVLRGLIFLLVNQQPSLISHVREKYDHGVKEPFQGVNAWVVLSKVFENILQDPSLKSTYLIVDALDECVTDRQQLLDLIVQKSSGSPCVKWIVSSRNWPNIEERLETAGQKVTLRLELNTESISAAVNMYIQHKVLQLAHLKKYDDKTQDTVCDHLSSNANDTFLWVALVCQELEKIPKWNTLAKLKAFPPGLDSLYKQMMEQVCNLEGAELYKRILALVSIVHRPVTLRELKSLVQMLDDVSDDIESLREIVGYCGSFLTLREDTPYFVHQSAKEFLLGQASSEIFPSGIGEVHYAVFSRSLDVMSRTLRRDIYGLGAPGFPIDKINQPDPDPLAAAQYSCVYWVDHLHDWYSANASQGDGFEECSAVDSFLREKYLYWLEALSLLRSMSEGVLQMAKLEILLQGRAKASRLTDIVRDARRFIRYYKSAIENSPLQVYASALVFSPTRSLTKELFKQEKPEWITTRPAMEDNWSACLQTLEGHSDSVNSVTFSHDSNQVASASADTTVKIWDTSSGQCLQTLIGHRGSVSSVAFSHNSKQVASASHDGTVKIWDAASGQCLHMLEGHRRWVLSVAFSHNSNQVASASLDSTVKIWDAASGQYLHTLEGHSDSVNSVAFSHDSKQVVSASWDYTAKIWDATSGQCLHTLEGYSGLVRSVAFSHDSKRVVSASDDKSVKIWDTASGQCLQMLEGHSSSVMSVAFSHDSKQVVSASNHGTVKIWEAASGQYLLTLEGHSSSVRSVVFSHNSKQVASASHDKTVKIWDAASSQCLQMLEGHSSSVMSVAFSHDSKQVVSASYDKTVKIWDTSSGQCLQTLEGHSSSVESVAFSHNSKQVASASFDMIVKIWDATSGQCLQTLMGHRGSVNSIAFSHDSKQIASASEDATVKIWDTASGQCLQTLEGHSSSVKSVAFPYDSNQVASASYDKTVKIWDAASGQCLHTLKGHRGSVNSVAFSHNSKQVASASHDGTVKIWDVASSQCLQTLEIGRTLLKIWFYITGLYLFTDIGVIVLDISNSRKLALNTALNASQMPRRRGYGFSSDGVWITWNSENLLWLPLEYRPRCSAVAVSSAVAVGCASGRVLVFNLTFDKL